MTRLTDPTKFYDIREEEDEFVSANPLRSLRAGITGLRSSAHSSAAALGAALGATDFAAGQSEQAEQAAGRAAQMRGRIPTLEEADSLGDYASLAVDWVAGNVPLLATMLLTRGVGGAVGARAGAARAVPTRVNPRAEIAQRAKNIERGRAIGGVAGAGLPYGATTIGDTFARISNDPDATGTEQEQAWGAIGSGLGQTALGLGPFEKLFRNVAKHKGIGRTAATVAAAEGVTEAAESAIQRATHAAYNEDINLTDKDAIKEYLENALAGAVVGGTYGAVGAGGRRMVDKLFPETEQTEGRRGPLASASMDPEAEMGILEGMMQSSDHLRGIPATDRALIVESMFSSLREELGAAGETSTRADHARVMRRINMIADVARSAPSRDRAAIQNQLRITLADYVDEGDPVLDDIFSTGRDFEPETTEETEASARYDAGLDLFPEEAPRTYFRSVRDTPYVRSGVTIKDPKTGEPVKASGPVKALEQMRENDPDSLYEEVPLLEELRAKYQEPDTPQRFDDEVINPWQEVMQREALAIAESTKGEGRERRIALAKKDPEKFLEKFSVIRKTPVAAYHSDDGISLSDRELAPQLSDRDHKALKQVEADLEADPENKELKAKRSALLRLRDPILTSSGVHEYRRLWATKKDGSRRMIDAINLTHTMMRKTTRLLPPDTPLLDRLAVAFATGIGSLLEHKRAGLASIGTEVRKQHGEISTDIPDGLVIFRTTDGREVRFSDIKHRFDERLSQAKRVSNTTNEIARLEASIDRDRRDLEKATAEIEDAVGSANIADKFSREQMGVETTRDERMVEMRQQLEALRQEYAAAPVEQRAEIEAQGKALRRQLEATRLLYGAPNTKKAWAVRTRMQKRIKAQTKRRDELIRNLDKEEAQLMDIEAPLPTQIGGFTAEPTYRPMDEIEAFEAMLDATEAHENEDLQQFIDLANSGAKSAVDAYLQGAPLREVPWLDADRQALADEAANSNMRAQQVPASSAISTGETPARDDESEIFVPVPGTEGQVRRIIPGREAGVREIQEAGRESGEPEAVPLQPIDRRYGSVPYEGVDELHEVRRSPLDFPEQNIPGPEAEGKPLPPKTVRGTGTEEQRLEGQKRLAKLRHKTRSVSQNLPPGEDTVGTSKIEAAPPTPETAAKVTAREKAKTEAKERARQAAEEKRKADFAHNQRVRKVIDKLEAQESQSRLEKLQYAATRSAKRFGLPNIKVMGVREFMNLYRAASNAVDGGVEFNNAIYNLQRNGLYGLQAYLEKSNTFILFINPTMTETEAAITLMHEIGHVVFKTALQNAPDGVMKAMYKEFREWRRGHLAQPHIDKILRSRNTMAAESLIKERYKGKDATGRMFETLLGPEKPALREKDVAEVLAFEEWFAEGVSTWAQTTKAPRTMLERLFKSLADKIKEIIRIFGPLRGAPKTVDAYMTSLMNYDGKVHPVPDRIKERAFDRAAPKGRLVSRSEADTRVGLEDEITRNGIQMLSDLPGGTVARIDRAMQRSLTKEDRAVIYRAAQSYYMQQRMRDIVQRTMPADASKVIISNLREADWAAGVMYVLMRGGRLRTGPEARTALDKFTDKAFGKARRALNMESSEDTFNKILQRIGDVKLGDTDATPQDKGEYTPETVSAYVKDPEQQTRAQKAYDNITAWGEWIDRRFFAPLFRNVYERAKRTNNPAITKIADEVFASTYSSHFQKQSMLEAARVKLSEFQTMFVENMGGTEVVNNDALMRAAGRVGLNPELAATAGADVLNAVEQLWKINEAVYTYMRNAGVEFPKRDKYVPWIFNHEVLSDPKMYDKLEQMALQMRFRENWEDVRARHITEAALRKARAAPDFTGNFDWDGEYARALGSVRGDRKGTIKFIKEYMKRATRDPGLESSQDMAEGWSARNPGFRFMNTRELWFLMAKGNEADRRTMLQVLRTDPRDIMARYIRSAVKRAEFSRRFGMNGEHLDELLREAKRTGATKRDIRMIEDFVDATMGTYGTRTKNWLFEHMIKDMPLPQSFKDSFKTAGTVSPKMRNAMGWIIVYQNYRLLGLSALSSLVDPVGIAVRSGSMTLFLRSFMQSIHALYKGADKSTLLRAAESIGTINRHLVADAVMEHFTNGMHFNRRQQKLNDTLFRWNGMDPLTRFSRLTATAGALSFLKQHVKDPTKHSNRYLAELGLEKADVVFDETGEVSILSNYERSQANEKEVARDDRVRNAIHRFVDGSIVRPDAAQRPLWMNDPNFTLVSYLQGFPMSFHERIMKRIWEEGATHGNITPLFTVMAFIPVMLAAQAIRYMIQFGDEEPPWVRNWDLDDHVWHAVKRSGLMGRYEAAYDAQHDAGYKPEAILGPVAEQMGEIVRGRSSFEKSAPLQNVWRFRMGE